MGNFASKIFYFSSCENNVSNKGSNKDITTPMKYCTTPPSKRKVLSLDPRSVSSGIPRTPIDVTPTPSKVKNQRLSAIPCRLQVKPYLETNFDDTLPVPTLKNDFDPRSPNVPQPRPPIIIPRNNDSCEVVEMHEHNLDTENVYTDPRSPSINIERTPIPKSKSPLNDHKSISITEEPHFEYCETISTDNLPEIQALPDITKNLQMPRQSFEDILKEIDEIENDETVELKSENKNDSYDFSSDFFMEKDDLSLNTQKLIDNILKIALKTIEMENNDKIQIWQDQEKNEITTNEQDFGDELKEEKENDEVDNKDIYIGKERNSDHKRQAEYTMTEHEPAMNRTPLGNRSNNHNYKHKKSKNLTQNALKNKSIFTMNQQENTPPGKKSVKSTKLSATHWDPDNTIVI